MILIIEEHGLGIFLYKATGDDAVALDTHLGICVRLQTTVLGKAMLAYMPPKVTKRMVREHGLPQVTENTITNLETLFAEWKIIRKRGYAMDDKEQVNKMRCLGAPILIRTTRDSVL